MKRKLHLPVYKYSDFTIEENNIFDPSNAIRLLEKFNLVAYIG